VASAAEAPAESPAAVAITVIELGESPAVAVAPVAVAPVEVVEPPVAEVAPVAVAPVEVVEPPAVEPPAAEAVAVAPVAVVEPPAAEAPAVASVMSGVDIAHIEYDPPGRDIDGEYVLLWNTNDVPVDLTGWALSDGGAKHTYTFQSFALAPGAEVKLWSKRGKDDAANLYWNNRTAIWNNDGDTGTLKDASGVTISVYTYTGKKR
jgi:hypothetical protein